MIGGGGYGWEPGEFTDDTQMAIILGESLVEHGALDPADVFERWRAWASTAQDVGSRRGRSCASGDWRTSATPALRADRPRRRQRIADAGDDVGAVRCERLARGFDGRSPASSRR